MYILTENWDGRFHTIIHEFRSLEAAKLECDILNITDNADYQIEIEEGDDGDYKVIYDGKAIKQTIKDCQSIVDADMLYAYEDIYALIKQTGESYGLTAQQIEDIQENHKDIFGV